MAHIGDLISLTGEVPADWPVMVHDPATDYDVKPGGLETADSNLAVSAQPMTIGQVRAAAAHLGPDSFIVITDDDGPPSCRTEFVVEYGRGRIVVGGWDWVTRSYLPNRGEQSAAPV